MLRQPLLMLSRSDRVKDAGHRHAGVRAAIVARYVPGESTDDAVDVVARARGVGPQVTLDFLGEDTLDGAQADATVAAYLELLEALADARPGRRRRGVGQAVRGRPGAARRSGEKVAAARTPARSAGAARDAGTTVTLDMEDHTTTDSTLRVLRELRKDFPETGAVLQAYLRRTEADCRDLAVEGSRVRLCKGAYNEPESVAFQSRHDVDLATCAACKVLMEGEGYPMVATHDPRHGRDRRRARRPHGRDAGQLRVPDALRHPPRRAAAAGRRRARRCASTCPTARSGTATSCAGWPSARATSASSSGRWSRRSDDVGAGAPVMGCTGRHPRRRRDGGDPALRPHPGRPAGRLPAGRREAAASAPPSSTSGTASRWSATATPPARPTPSWSSSSRRTWASCSPRSRPTCGPGQLVVSLAAGITTAFIESRLPDGVAVVRVMPNTPALVDEGMAAISRGSHCDEAHLAEAESLMASTGRVVRVPEQQQDAVTAISGSGPAYLFFVVEAMIEAGVHLGLPRTTADRARRADRRRLGQAAARDRRAPDGAARAGHLARRHDGRGDPRSSRTTRCAPRSSPRWRRRATGPARSPRAAQ